MFGDHFSAMAVSDLCGAVGARFDFVNRSKEKAEKDLTR